MQKCYTVAGLLTSCSLNLSYATIISDKNELQVSFHGANVSCYHNSNNKETNCDSNIEKERITHSYLTTLWY